jgi:RNA polymerase sigma-70 factor (ECF subfamily)
MEPLAPVPELSPSVRDRLLQLWERTGDVALKCLAEDAPPRPGVVIASKKEQADWLSTCLMETYKNTGDTAVFSLLFELNQPVFLVALQSHLRRAICRVDAADVLQEVFLNIYRYPHRFVSDRADAFRNWGHRIVRNTLLKFLKGQARLARFRDIDDEAVQPEDVRTRRPDRAASEAESAGQVNQAFLLYLQLYLHHFAKLSPRERLALTMVEVEGASYRDAADALSIRLENLKMVIFRGRRKIFRGMERSLADFAQASEATEADGPKIRRTMEPTGRGQRLTGDQHEAAV